MTLLKTSTESAISGLFEIWSSATLDRVRSLHEGLDRNAMHARLVELRTCFFIEFALRTGAPCTTASSAS